MIVHLWLLSIVNIGAGFALAIALGRRYRKIATRRVWASLLVNLPPSVPGSGPVTVRSAAAPPPPQSGTAPVATAVPLPKSPGYIAVVELHDRVANFATKLIEADEQLRQCVASPDLGTIESVLNNIEITARNYVESRESVQQRLADLTREEGAWESINNEIIVAAQIQDTEIKATCQKIVNFDYESDLASGCQKIVGSTHRLLNSNDMLRDTLQKARPRSPSKNAGCPSNPIAVTRSPAV